MKRTVVTALILSLAVISISGCKIGIWEEGYKIIPIPNYRPLFPMYHTDTLYDIDDDIFNAIIC